MDTLTYVAIFVSAGLGVTAANALIFGVCTYLIVREHKADQKAIKENTAKVEAYIQASSSNFKTVVEQLKETGGKTPRSFRVFRNTSGDDESGPKGSA